MKVLLVMLRKLKMQKFVLLTTAILLISCESGTSYKKDYCLHTNPEEVGTLEEAIKYDCLCSDDPIDIMCEGQ